ncbi:MAG: class I SAM-dependent methyltransferase [Alphaproteobacteria bacterium]
MNTDSAKSKFIEILKEALERGDFVKLSLGHYTGGDEGLKKIHVRRIMVKCEEKLSFTYHYQTRDIVKNHDARTALGKIQSALEHEFKTATLFTTQQDLIFENNTLKEKLAAQTRVQAVEHDRAKKRWLPSPGTYYLQALKITDPQGRVFDKAQDKFRQINKYIEVIDSLTKDMPPESLHTIIDMGAGKGYLTFALYDYLKNIRKIDAQVTGVEQRADLVSLCNKIAVESSFGSLKFEQGSITDFKTGAANLLIALHACDTATDDAIAKGIMAGAALIIAAPCCHKQIRREMETKNTDSPFGLLTRHGIFMERQAEMVTDALRGLFLEYYGYEVKIFEFISDAHTAKNIMITAQKKKGDKNVRSKTAEDIGAFKKQFGVTTHYLEGVLAG